MKQRENIVQLRINVNAETKKAFDAICAAQGMTMTAVIERFMEEYSGPKGQKKKGEKTINIIGDMLSGVTPEVFEQFRQGGLGNWFQMFADGRVMVGHLPERLRGLADAGKFRAASTPTSEQEKEAPIIAIEACGFYTFEEFLAEIREQLDEFY